MFSLFKNPIQKGKRSAFAPNQLIDEEFKDDKLSLNQF